MKKLIARGKKMSRRYKLRVRFYSVVDKCESGCIWLQQWTRNRFKPVQVNEDQVVKALSLMVAFLGIVRHIMVKEDEVPANASVAASHEHIVDIVALDKEAVSKATHSESASEEEAVSEATHSESDSDEEAISEFMLSDLASDEETVSRATLSDLALVTISDSASDEAAVSGAALSDLASDEAAVSGATLASDEEAVSGATLSNLTSDEEAVSEATCSESASDKEAVSEDAHLESCIYFNAFKNHCRSIFYWFVHAFKAACHYQKWSYSEVGITSNQGALDGALTAILRRNLKKRIEKVESTISEVKKSALLAIASKSPSDEIANKNRSKIRTVSHRKVFGREALRDKIMAKLRENSHGTSPCYSVIGIYGVAGSGKTTFARYIRDFIGECKEEERFDTIICIHVSENFSVADIFHEMLKDITEDRHSNISDCDDLEEKLKESLCGKRFCLILDDLWEKVKNDPQLEQLISPLNVGLKGSKILVTARTQVAAGALCADEPLEMPDLDEDQYLSMFMHYALGGIANEEFKRSGSVIAEKLRRSPIAAVIVAGRLGASRDINFWKNTAELDMLNDTMDALWWSYQQLSPDTRRCFEYCNIFPRRYKMKKGDLVNLWIAQGFVKTSCATDHMEDVAEGYIQELVSCSFLQPVGFSSDDEYFIIHDLLHDLAEMVTGSDYFRIENEGSQGGECWKGIPREVCHLFIQNYDAKLITKKILRLKKLRTLIINIVGRDAQDMEKVIDSIGNKLPKLRVLAFALSVHRPIEQVRKLLVTESVGQLKHLRYFAFRIDYHYHCNITLPGTLNKLQHIQLLDFGGGGDILEFNFAQLVNLRHICCYRYVKLPYIGKLSSLQTLSGFKVSNDKGCELKQLRDLNKLRGKLHISGLANVKSKGQAREANLAAKELTELELMCNLDYGTMCSPEVEADVLEGLCPPMGLQKLRLWNFACSRYPDWMMSRHGGGPC